LGGVETERVDNVVDLESTILDTLLGLLSGCVGTSVYISISAVVLVPKPSLQAIICIGIDLGVGIRTDFDSAEGNHGAVDLVHSTIDLLQVVGVGDDLVTGENILHWHTRSVTVSLAPYHPSPTCSPTPLVIGQSRRSGVVLAG